MAKTSTRTDDNGVRVGWKKYVHVQCMHEQSSVSMV